MGRCLISVSTPPIKPNACSPLWKHFSSTSRRILIWDRPTLNVGTVHAGLNVNSVPDLAEIGIDIRSIPGLDHSRIQEHLKAELGDDISLEPTVDVGAVWTDPSVPWIKEVYQIVRDVTGEVAGPEPRTAPYFTDASALTPVWQPADHHLGARGSRQ